MTKRQTDRKEAAEFSEAALDALIGDARTPEDVEALFRRICFCGGDSRPARTVTEIVAAAASP